MQLFRRQNSERNLAPDAQPLTDWQLLEQFVERRDQDAFESLVRMHGPMVLGVCRRVTGHHQDAEEAFQAAFLALAQSGVDLAAANAGELALRGRVSHGSQTENRDCEETSQGETDCNAAGTGGSRRA